MIHKQIFYMDLNNKTLGFNQIESWLWQFGFETISKNYTNVRSPLMVLQHSVCKTCIHIVAGINNYNVLSFYVNYDPESSTNDRIGDFTWFYVSAGSTGTGHLQIILADNEQGSYAIIFNQYNEIDKLNPFFFLVNGNDKYTIVGTQTYTFEGETSVLLGTVTPYISNFVASPYTLHLSGVGIIASNVIVSDLPTWKGYASDGAIQTGRLYTINNNRYLILPGRLAFQC